MEEKKNINYKLFLFFFVVGVILFYVLVFFLQNRKIPLTKIEVDSSKVTLNYGDIAKLNVFFYPYNATDKDVYWSSSDENLVSVDEDGYIKVNKNESGEAIITVKAKNGNFEDSTKVIVLELDNIINVTSVLLDVTEVDLKYGESVQLIAKVLPEDATNKNITWSSDNKLVSVSQTGKLTVNSNRNGAAIITAKSDDGEHFATTKVNVLKVEKVIKVKEIAINNKELQLKYGDTAQLVATIKPSNATNKNVVWSSSNSGLVSVSQTGKLTINRNDDGEAIIYVKSVDGNYEASCKVKVSKVNNVVNVTGLMLNQNEISLAFGETKQLGVEIIPNNATNKNIVWSSSDSSLVSVSQTGKLTVNKNIDGGVVISAKSEDGGYTATTNVYVSKVDINIKATGISVDKREVKLNYGETMQLVANVKPEDATNKNVIWSSSDSSLVSVSQTGVLTVNKNTNGSAIVTAKSEDGSYTATVKVQVMEIDTTVRVNSISLNKGSDQILLNNSNLTTTLTATIYPSNATNQNVVWSSSNPTVATVDNNGVVTAKALGSTVISVTTEDGGKTASATIAVKKNVIIVLGASQVTKMAEFAKSYTSASNNTYKVSDKTLIYVHKSGSLIIYQTTTGYDTAVNHIKSIAGNLVEYVNFYLFFPLVGNTIKKFDCSEFTTSNTTMIGYANNYNDSIKKLINSGYRVKGYIVSMHPVKVSQSGSSTVVVNENKNSCAKGYRSNRKYYYFNQNIELLTSQLNPKYVRYIDTFSEIMMVADPDKNYTYKITYDTSDGVHWNSPTTQMYVNMMFNLTNDL